jgi:phytol kinase
MVSQGDILGLAGVYVYVGLVVAAAAKLRFVGNAKAHRKFVHIMVGNIVFIWWVFDSNIIMAFLAAAPFIPLLFLASRYSPLARVKGSFLGKTTEESHDLGLVYYAISWTVIAFLLFDYRLAASIGIVAMAYGDGLGGLVGRKLGRYRLHGKKTVEGTLAVFLGTTAVSFVVIQFYMYLSSTGVFVVPAVGLTVSVAGSLIIGGMVAIVELITPGQFDNVAVPILAAVLAIALGIR